MTEGNALKKEQGSEEGRKSASRKKGEDTGKKWDRR